MISVIVPCFNEKQHIEACVRSLLCQEPPAGGLEIIVVDGLSDDGTRDILRKLASQHSELRIVDNPGRTTPRGMNIGIRAARGGYVAILGAHCDYAMDYLRTCVELLDEHPEASCVGGPIVSQGRSLFGQAVAAAMSHPVGIGNAKHRHPHYEGYAEGACYPVFRREIFDQIGFYDETLVRNQDDELNYRLAKFGGKVFLSPRARSTYFVQGDHPCPVSTILSVWLLAGGGLEKASDSGLSPAARTAPLYVFMLMAAVLGLSLPGYWQYTAGVLPLVYGATLLVVGAKARQQDWVAGCAPVSRRGRDHACRIRSRIYVGASQERPAHEELDVFNNKGECHASRT